MAVREALSELAGAPLQRLHHKQDDGKRLFDSLAATCIRASAGRKATPGLTGIDLYFEVFDFAGSHHFGTWIIDYVAEVCGNPSLTSNDALEAQLLDGSFVKAWCHRTIQAMEERLLRSLSTESALESYSTKEVVLEISLTEVVISVLEALGSIRGAARSRGPSGGGAVEETMADAHGHDRGGSGVADDLSRAARLRRTQSLVQWCGEHRLASYPPTGAFASLSDWRARVRERQDGRRQLHTAPKTFLDGLLEALSLKGHYPFPSILSALSALAAAAGRTGEGCGGDGPAAWCVAGSAGGAAPDMRQWECCLALAVYYLTDINVLHRHTPTGNQLLDSLTSSLHLHPAQLATWCAAPLLDDSLVSGEQDDGAVEQASRLLLSHAPPHLHISFLQVLSYLGHPNTALSLHRARDQGVSEQPHDMDTAWALTELRLRCGLVAEAFAMSRQYAAAQPDASSRRAVLSRLLSGILDWCDAHAPRDQCSTTLLELCCGEEEEPVLVQWLLGRAQRQQAVGGLLTVALAARGCLPEAVAAQGRLMAMNPGADQLTAALVDSALQGLPVPLRDITVDDDGGAGLALGATGLLPGLILDSDTHTPHMHVALSGTLPPALTSTRVPALPPTWRSATQQVLPEGPSRPGGLFPDTQGELQGGASLTGIPATGSAAMVGSLPARERLPLAAWTPATGVSVQGVALQPPLGGGGEAAGGSLFAGGPLPPVPPPLDWLAGSGRIVGNGSSGGGAGPGATPSRASLFSLSAYGAGAELLTGATDVPTMKRARPNTWMQQ